MLLGKILFVFDFAWKYCLFLMLPGHILFVFDVARIDIVCF